jgi:hypothetical protein
VVLDAVNDTEALSYGLSGKIWHKTTILSSLPPWSEVERD